MTSTCSPGSAFCDGYYNPRANSTPCVRGARPINGHGFRHALACTCTCAPPPHPRGPPRVRRHAHGDAAHLASRGSSSAFRCRRPGRVSFDLVPGSTRTTRRDGAGKSTLIKCLAGVHQPDREGSSSRTTGEPPRHRGRRAARHRHHPPGVQPGHPAQRGRERDARTSAAGCGCRQDRRDEPPGHHRDVARRARDRPADSRFQLGRRSPAARRKRQGTQPRRSHPHHGRADGRARRRRGRQAAEPDERAALAGCGHHLHLPPPRRDPAHRRQGDRAARRTVHHHGARLDIDRRTGPADGRPVDRRPVPKGARRGRRDAAGG